MQEGAPSGVTSLTQAADGYIWIGTQTGVYRFDGDKFEAFTPTSGRLLDAYVQGVFAPRSGGVWVGYAFGGLSFIKAGKVTNFTRKDGLGGGTTSGTGLAEDSRGHLWVASGADAVYRLDEGHFTQVRSRQGSAKWPIIYAIAIDEADTVWIGGVDALKYKRANEDDFTDIPVPKGVIVAIREGDHHSLWLHYGDGRNVSVDVGVGEPLVAQRVFHRQVNEIHSNSHGLWMASENDGLMHAADPQHALVREGVDFDNAFESFGAKEGLSSNQATALLEDAEGDIWVGTNAGLDRFRPVNFVSAQLPPGLDSATLLAGLHNEMWVGSQSLKVIQASGDSPHPVNMPAVITSGLAEPSGGMLFGGLDGIYRLDPAGALTQVAPSPRPGQGVMIWGLAKRRDGTILAAMAALDSPLFQYKDGRWSHFDEGASPSAVYVDEQDAVWRAYRATPVLHENLVTRLQDGTTTSFHTPVGALNLLTRIGSTLWVAGADGVAWLKGDTFLPLQIAGTPFTGVTGLVEDAKGNLWLHGERGVARISAAALAAALKTPSTQVPSTLFDESDGLPGTPTGVPPNFTAAATTDGRLWFSTIGGVVWVDPAAIFTDQAPPLTVIKAVVADNEPLPLASTVELKPHTNNVAFKYGALSFRAPEHVRYRYRLNGVDREWHEAGTVTETTYTHLGPGHYQFEVQASVADGGWSQAAASQAITILPGPLQSWWFRLLCMGVAAAGLMVLHFRRVARAKKIVRVQAEAKSKERERIAREIHDTLLQSTQSLLLMVEVAIDCDEPTKQKGLLQRTVTTARESIKEGRDRIIELRTSPESREQDLSFDLSYEARERALIGEAQFIVVVTGRIRVLQQEHYCDLVDLCREALRNAFMHADARRIELHIAYSAMQLRVDILDDGVGIPSPIALAGRDGHFGLSGMRERATNMGARFTVSPRNAGGTAVTLVLPAARAYERVLWGRWG